MLVGAGMAHNVGMDESDFLPAQAAELAVAPPPVRRLSFVTAEGRTISALQYGDAETGGFPDPAVTLLHGAGGYTGESKEVLYCVVTRLEVDKLKEIVLEKDENAFVTINAVHDIVGGRFKKKAIH